MAFGFFRSHKLYRLQILLAVAIMVSLTSVARSQARSQNEPPNAENLSPYTDFSPYQTSKMHILTPDECHASQAAVALADLGTYVPPMAPLGAGRGAGSGVGSGVDPRAEPSTAYAFPFSWTPTGAAPRVPDAGCEPELLGKALRSAGNSVQAQATAMHAYFARCDQSLREDAPSGVWALLKTASTRYDFCDHPNIRKVILHLNNGDTLRGFLALKPGSEKRPLIVAKCGVFCNAGTDASLRFLMMHLFDESPFNVLALSNVTGWNFVADNGFVMVGGFYEGQQVIDVVKAVRSSSLNNLVSSVHFVGASLGSQAGLYAAYMSPFNTEPGEPPLLTSALAACPVVDLKEAMFNLFSDSTRGWLARRAYNYQENEALMANPRLNGIFPDSSLPTDQLAQAMASLVVKHFKNIKPGWATAPFQDVTIHSEADFWRLNSFLNFAQTPLTTPTLAFAGDDDQVVPAVGNATELQRILAQQKHQSSDPITTALAAFTIPSGNHCAFDTIYGWRVMSTVFRSYVLSHSPEMTGREHNRAIKLPSELLGRANSLYPNETHVVEEFRFQKDSPDLEVTFKIFAPWPKECNSVNPRNPPTNCQRNESVSIPLEVIRAQSQRLPQMPKWAHIPKTDTEAEAMTRWANVHMSVIDSHGRELELGNQAAVGLKWNAFEIN